MAGNVYVEVGENGLLGSIAVLLDFYFAARKSPGQNNR